MTGDASTNSDAAVPVSGLVQQLAVQSELRGFEQGMFSLILPDAHKKLAEPVFQQRLQAALSQVLGMPVKLAISGTKSAPLARRHSRT